MTKARIALLVAALAAAPVVGVVSAAHAQYYGSDERMYADAPESVTVRPYYPRVEKRQILGRVNGEINPTAYSLSRPVGTGDLDLTYASDRQELRDRVYETAVNLCYALDDQVPSLRNNESGDRECVRTATRNAMRDAYDRY